MDRKWLLTTPYDANSVPKGSPITARTTLEGKMVRDNRGGVHYVLNGTLHFFPSLEIFNAHRCDMNQVVNGVSQKMIFSLKVGADFEMPSANFRLSCLGQQVSPNSRRNKIRKRTRM